MTPRSELNRYSRLKMHVWRAETWFYSFIKFYPILMVLGTKCIFLINLTMNGPYVCDITVTPAM